MANKKRAAEKQPTKLAQRKTKATTSALKRTAPDPIGPTGRNDKGRFAAGNVGGPGRPPRRTEERYHRMLTSCIDLNRFEAMVANTLDIALNHKDASTRLKAQALLFDRLLPKPRNLVEDEPEELRVAGHTRAEVNRIMLERITANLALPQVIEVPNNGDSRG